MSKKITPRQHKRMKRQHDIAMTQIRDAVDLLLGHESPFSVIPLPLFFLLVSLAWNYSRLAIIHDWSPEEIENAVRDNQFGKLMDVDASLMQPSQIPGIYQDIVISIIPHFQDTNLDSPAVIHTLRHSLDTGLLQISMASGHHGQLVHTTFTFKQFLVPRVEDFAALDDPSGDDE